MKSIRVRSLMVESPEIRYNFAITTARNVKALIKSNRLWNFL